MTPPQMRAALDAFYEKYGTAPAPADAGDAELPGPSGPIKFGLYRPLGPAAGPLPVIVVFKGSA